MARAPGATKLFFVSGSPFASLCLQFFSGFAALEFIGSLPAFRLQLLVPRRQKAGTAGLDESTSGYMSAFFSKMCSLVYAVP